MQWAVTRDGVREGLVKEVALERSLAKGAGVGTRFQAAATEWGRSTEVGVCTACFGNKD